MSPETSASWIREVKPEEASGDGSRVLAEIRAARGHVSNLWRTMGHAPAGLRAAFDHYRALMDDPAPLTKAQAEMIALVVSATNGCGYCVAHHGPRLAKALGDESLARAVALDYREANLAARDRVMLDAAVALTCEPSERKLEDVERLREYGFEDAAILQLVQIAAYYNFVNRIASSLGVPIEDGLEPWEFGAQK